MATINGDGTRERGAQGPDVGANTQVRNGSNPLQYAEVSRYTDPASLAVDPNYPLPQQSTAYHPNRRDSNIRMQLYRRYYEMRDNDWRTEAEAQWEMADKEYMMWRDDAQHLIATTQENGQSYSYEVQNTTLPDPDSTRSRLQLPDAFAAIQSHMQETVGRKSRPALHGTNESDEPVEDFANAVLNYNMDNTNFDYEWFMSGIAAAVRGTSFLLDYWRFEQRWVRDADDVDKEGNITYTERLITDYDDDYTEWKPNEYVYVDEKGRHIDMAVDMVDREILNIRDFQRKYGLKKGFRNVEYVKRGGETTTRAFFKLPKDITGNDVEVLHYYNRNLDVYWVAANWVIIHDGPLPTKHKELPVGVRYYYRVPGRFWGMGIPHVLHMLAAERTSIRNLNMDRQNLQINKMFLHNNMFDITEEDLVSRPHGLISVDTNGQPLRDAIVPIEYGDVPPSYFKTDQIMVEDMVRATGIDVRLESQPSTQTATEAALKQETFLKRINMIAQLDEEDTIVRIGRLKWSNIQFFYPKPRMDTIVEDNEQKEQTVNKTITIKGKKFEIVDENGVGVLRMSDVLGASQLQLTGKMAKYLEGSFDVSVAPVQYQPSSRVVQQTKVTEMFSLLMGNPLTMSRIDLDKALPRLLEVNDEKAKDWLNTVAENPGHMMLLAEQENRVMAAGQPLAPTPGATEDHTLMHIMFTKSQEYTELVQRRPEIRQLFMEHIMGEHEANPATNTAAEAMSANGLGGNGSPNGPGNPNMKATPPGEIGQLPNLPAMGLTASPQNQPQAQMAGIKSTNLSKPTRTGV